MPNVVQVSNKNKTLYHNHMPNVVQPYKTWVLKTKNYITTLLHMPNVVQLSNKNKTLYHNHMPNLVQWSKIYTCIHGL